MIFSPPSKVLIKKNSILLIDLDNTLVFTDRANNEAYLKAIHQYLPNFIFPVTERITRSVVQKLLYKYPEKLINKIIQYKECNFYKYLNLTEINLELYNLLIKHKENPKFLVTIASQYRTVEILKFHNLNKIFTQEIYVKNHINKYSFIKNLNPSVRSHLLIFEDNPIYLQNLISINLTPNQLILI